MNINDIWFANYGGKHGGECPECGSKETTWWTTEEVPENDEEYNIYKEWLQCKSCGHSWKGNPEEMSNILLLNSGRTQEQIDESVERIKNKVKDLLDKARNNDNNIDNTDIDDE